MGARVSIGLPVFNGDKYVASTIDAILAQTYSEFEMIITDNASTDATADICSNQSVRFIQHRFEGHIEQKNYAMHQATHDYVLSLDADEALSETLNVTVAPTHSV